jgi:hypothetical protein
MRPLLMLAGVFIIAVLAAPFIFVQSAVETKLRSDADHAISEREHGLAVTACAEALPELGLSGTMRIRDAAGACHACDLLLSPASAAGAAKAEAELRYVRTHDQIRERLAEHNNVLAAAVIRRANAMDDEDAEITDPYMDRAGENFCATYASVELASR